MYNPLPPSTTVEILDKTLTKVGEFTSFYPLDNSGLLLQYSKELSNFGRCRFRVSPLDPRLMTDYGYILTPHKYHIRIRRGNAIVFQGAITDIPHRTRNYIEVVGSEYEFYLDKVFVKMTSAVGYNEVAPTEDIGMHYRILDSGTLATAVSNFITEAVAQYGPGHILANVQLGTIENPDFPEGLTDSSGATLSGAWSFSSDYVVQFSYQSVLYALKMLGAISYSDFELVDDNGTLTFNFKKFLGNKDIDKTFVFAEEGDVIDFDLPLRGSDMHNDIFGIAAQTDGTVLHSEVRDEQSIQDNGFLQDAVGFIDVRNQNALQTRLNLQLRLQSTYDGAPLNFVLDENSEPLGSFGVGDLRTTIVKWGVIDYKAVRRIVGYTVGLYSTGREFITVQTNIPNPGDTGN